MKIVFFSTRPHKPSFRFRIAALRPFFEQAGHHTQVAFLPASPLQRWSLYFQYRDYDVILVQKRLLGPWDLALLRRLARCLIYDIDDAVMYHNNGQPHPKQMKRFQAMVRRADLVICGNAFLAEHARRFSARVEVVPTPIDTQTYQPRPTSDNSPPVIGWSGSTSTNRFFNQILPFIAPLGTKAQVKVISNDSTGIDWGQLGQVPHTFVSWSPEREVSVIQSFDIGLMPLPDNQWTRGKCGLKALQYMACGVVTVCSPVGVNRTIIMHGHNGFLPATYPDWLPILEKLVTAPEIRQNIGMAGRQRVEQEYAVAVQGPRLVALVEKAVDALV